MSDSDSPAPDTAQPGPDDEKGEDRHSFTKRLRAALDVLIPRNRTRETPGQTPDPQGAVRQRVMLDNVRRMGAMRVSDAMVPRADVAAVEAGTSFAEIANTFHDAGHSRLPVYRDTLDDPLGFIHVKDLFMAYGGRASDEQVAAFKATDHLRRTLNVPPSMPCGTLLQAMQAQRMHIALVIDEYGGVDGLVTIEDLLELIVGEIEDEHDAANGDTWTRDADGSYRASARAYLEDFEAETGVQLLEDPDEDVDTLGGLVFMLANRVPARGEVIRHPQGHEFEVLDADPRRIKRLRVRLADPDEPEVSADEAHAQAAQ